jgi:PAS domain S-box-containing protein
LAPNDLSLLSNDSFGPAGAVSGINVFDITRESIIVCDADGVITNWNKASERIYGWPAVLAEGRRLDELLGGREWLATAMLKTLEPTSTSSIEIRRRTASGREVIVSSQLSMIRDTSGRPVTIIETAVDVTEQRQAELLADTERRHYRNVFQAIPASVWVVDFSEGRALALSWLKDETGDLRHWFAERPERVRELMKVTYARDVSEEATKLFGPCARESLLVNVERYWPQSSTEDFGNWVASSLAGETSFSCETRQYRYNGEEFDALFTASYAPGTVEDGRLVVTIVDHSNAKNSAAAVRKSEAFYRDLFHGSAFSAWHLDATVAWKIFHALYDDGVTDFRAQMKRDALLIDRVMDGIRVVDVNDTTLQMFEAQNRDDIIGGSIARFWFPDERRETLLGSLTAAFNGISTFRGLGRMRTLQGNEIDVLFTRSASTALSSAGQLLLAVVDMTDKVQAQNALAEMQANFAHAARVSSLGEITASIAHEVNQPLGAITCNAAAARRWLDHSPPPSDELRSLIDKIIADGNRAAGIVAHVKSMAAPQAGEKQTLSANRLINEALTLLDSQIKKCRVTTVCDFESELPEISGDPIQLQQVIVNLILNALQAMAGQTTSHLLLQTRANYGKVILSVEDNGPGIPTASISKLFSSFFTTRPDGMGIGLAICRTIVEAHGGTISAENIGTGGARFMVQLEAA